MAVLIVQVEIGRLSSATWKFWRGEPGASNATSGQVPRISMSMTHEIQQSFNNEQHSIMSDAWGENLVAGYLRI